MKDKLYLSLVVVALLSVAGWTARAQLPRGSASRQAWEYKSILIVRPARSNSEFTSRRSRGN